MKKILLVAVLLTVAVVTVPLWGGCGLAHDLKNIWCDVRYFNSDTAELSCKARALAANAECLAEQGLDGAGIKL